MSRRRVVVLGGGVSGLTVAHELSRTQAARERWAVEVVEMGHKLGGRLFSAHRPEAGGRNEEHGLHVWFGFYDNAFRLAEEVWNDVQKPDGCPWASIWDALRPIHTSHHGIPGPEGFVVRRMMHSRNSDVPGSATPRSLTGHLTALIDLIRALPQTFLSLLRDQPDLPVRMPDGIAAVLWPTPKDPSVLRSLEAAIAPLLERVRDRAVDQEARSSASLETRRRSALRTERFLQRIHAPLVKRARSLADGDPAALEVVRLLDLALAVVRGVHSVEDGIYEDGDLDRVSAWELRAWLARHGLQEDTAAHCRLVEFLYDGPFAYDGGDRRHPVYEASTGLRLLFRLLRSYKFAIAFLMNAGAGETLVAPLVSLVRSRGVSFRLFHRLQRVEIDRASRRVTRLVFVRAAHAQPDYDPLVEHDGLIGLRADPDWSRIVGGRALAARGVDFYSRFAPDRGELDEVTLEVGRDFDDVVLALPLGAIAPDPDGHTPVADWLDAHPPARASIERLHLVPTVAAQLWFREPADAIGLHDRALVTWAEPFSIICDMSPVIRFERWPSPGPAACAYACGAAPLEAHRRPSSDRGAPERDLARAREALRAQLDQHAQSLLAPFASLHAGEGVRDPLDAQYVRVNVEPWELADLPLPGADAVRLEANGSGCVNLALAGTWIRTSMNTTSVEAAVSSGLAAARALGADVRPILSETLFRRPPRHPWLDGREPPTPTKDDLRAAVA